MSERSYWQDVPMHSFAPLRQNIKCDVAVIGGGITGLTAAYLLLRAGKTVCLIEKKSLGGGDTGSTTAHLTYVTDVRFSELVNRFGRDSARLVWQGGEAAINTVEGICNAEKLDCEFRRVPGFLHSSLPGTKDESESLHRDGQLAEELGFHTEFMPLVTPVAEQGLRFPGQARFHPIRYINGLAQAVVNARGMIFEQTEATEFGSDPHSITANGHRIDAGYIVIATHVPLMGAAGSLSAALFQTKLAPYSSYVVGAQLPKDVFTEGLFWDTSNPYYYLRIDRGEKTDHAIFGGLDHKTGQDRDAVKRFEELEQMLKDRIPEARPDRRWSGQVVETHDGLPFIGETAPGQFAATGFSGNGMTFGTLAAMMACDTVQGRKNPWQELFAPERKTLSSAWDYLKENFDYPYYLIRDRMSRAGTDSPQSVPGGKGKVVTLGGRKVACSRSDDGHLVCVSAICTHMGCVVSWNNAERTWDCPCHGSRFATTGEVLAGPASTPLAKLSSEGKELSDSAS